MKTKAGPWARALMYRNFWGRYIAANEVSGQVYAILDEVFLAGEIEETSKQVVLTRLEHLDKLE